MIAMHHAIFGRSPIIVNNLLTMSEGNVTTYPTKMQVVNAPISIVGFDNSIYFGDNSVLRAAYKANFRPNIGVTYNLSFFIEMEEGGVPVVGINNTSGDFRIITNGYGVSENITTYLYAGNIYRVSVFSNTILNNSNYGIQKHTTQSARKFKISGIQLTEGADLLPYKKTT